MRKLLNRLVPLSYGLYYNTFILFSKEKVAEQAFNLFCTIRKGKVLPPQKEYLDDAKLEKLRVANHDVQTYRWAGSNPTVVLVHGWESNTFRWRNLIAKLQEEDFNIVAFDAPGHGYSSGKQLYVPLYAEVLQKIIAIHDPKFLVAHSVGGMTAIYNAYRNNNPSVEKIVTVGSPSEFHELMEHYQKLLKFNNRVMEALDDYVLNRFGFHIRDFSTSEYVKTNPKEGLLFHDKFDKVTPYHASQKVHANWKGSQLVSTEGFGHSMHQDEVNEQIVNFLNS